MRKLLAVFVVVLMVGAVFGAATAEAAKKQYCFAMPNATHGFMAYAIQLVRENLARQGANFPDIETRLLTSADPSEQSNQLATLINEKVDTIVLWPHNGEDLRSAAQDVIDAGIKLVVFDRLIPDIAPISEADMDNFAYGVSCTKALNNFFKHRLDKGEKIKILVILGDNSTASNHRYDGLKETKHANIEIVQSINCDWQRSKGLDFMETFLANSRKEDIEAIDAIFSCDDEAVAGAFDAMINYNGSASLSNLKMISLVGWSEETVKMTGAMLEKFNILHHICFVAPAGVAETGVAVGFDVASGKEVPKQVKIGYLEINVYNYGTFLEEFF